ncbi:TlpA disulfide reductase family protein [Neolewinella lacunae]|uniref:TlpA family protein disulfide reductase n=1 Tax=Neolewinella lacunae TaxID=1517758 RepID=A0A923PI86_9BACT|nr:TlpA disulfide reductase family protein [Neolewinella lacunae]MBC6993764.1 TlpA family protein disulfide reductase [Neolewinella lacunae]MDN3636144.1 TlpA disulfide reductase family protein [Neolewinella lacunae]
MTENPNHPANARPLDRTRSAKNVSRALLAPLFLIAFLLSGCQVEPDAYEARYLRCMENVEVSTFSVEGSDKIGYVYDGFDEQCLIGAILPSFQSTTLQDLAVDDSHLEGKINVINTWFMECKPCLAEIPDLNALVDKYGVAEINYWAVTPDPRSEVEGFLEDHPFAFTIIADGQDLINSRLRLTTGYPTTIVTDEENRILAIFKGQSSNGVSTASKLDTLLSTLVTK